MASVSLVFPHQLFSRHPALAKDRPVWLIEDSLFFGDRHASPGKFHRQKLILHRASMQAYRNLLEGRGYTVELIGYDPDQPIDQLLEKRHRAGSFDEIVTVDPCDYLLERRLRRFADRADVPLRIRESPMFLTPVDWAESHFSSGKRPFMKTFYEAQRKRMSLLVDEEGHPEGGRWSFDDENRKPMPKSGLDVPALPPAPRNRWIDEAESYVEERFPSAPGDKSFPFCYIVTHRDATNWLDHFLSWRFDRFGPYEDAIAREQSVLFHSVLTPMLNTGLLTPKQVIDRTLDFAQDNEVPLNSLEGFVRQIVGWREFMHQMYRRHGVEMRTQNFFGHDRAIPRSFWEGTTGVEPVDVVIRRVRETGYAHHIERLMVIGNFMLLCGFDPVCVNDWFMELFIDSYDWVMVPNVFGMSQFADGGIFTTKPYISGSNYILKMSDHRRGDWCATWDGLFWSFVERHYDFFRSQHRLGMMARNLEKMDARKRRGHLETAESFLSQW